MSFGRGKPCGTMLVLLLLSSMVTPLHAETPQPILHSEVAAYSMPTPALHVPINHWKHTFRVPLMCLESILPASATNQLIASTEILVKTVDRFNDQCRNATEDKRVVAACEMVQEAKNQLIRAKDLLVSERSTTVIELQALWAILSSTFCSTLDMDSVNLIPKNSARKRRYVKNSSHKSSTRNDNLSADVVIQNLNVIGSGVMQIAIRTQDQPNFNNYNDKISNGSQSDELLTTEELITIREQYGARAAIEVKMIQSIISQNLVPQINVSTYVLPGKYRPGLWGELLGCQSS